MIDSYNEVNFCFQCEARGEVMQRICQNASNFIGIHIDGGKGGRKITSDQFQENKFGRYSGDLHVTSISEFMVYKQSPRVADPVRRTLCLSETCLIERDPATYSIGKPTNAEKCLHSLCEKHSKFTQKRNIGNKGHE